MSLWDATGPYWPCDKASLGRPLIVESANGCLGSIWPTTCPSSRSSRRSREGLARQGPRSPSFASSWKQNVVRPEPATAGPSANRWPAPDQRTADCRRTAFAARKVQRDPRTSKTAATAAGSALPQRLARSSSAKNSAHALGSPPDGNCRACPDPGPPPWLPALAHRHGFPRSLGPPEPLVNGSGLTMC
jgi:hypothetical protein